MVQETQITKIGGGPQACQCKKQSQQPSDSQESSVSSIKWLIQQEHKICKVHPAQLLQRSSGPRDGLPFPRRGNGNAIIQLCRARIHLRGLVLFRITWGGFTWRCSLRHHHHLRHHYWWRSTRTLGLLAMMTTHDATNETITPDATWHLKCWKHLKLWNGQIEQSNGNLKKFKWLMIPVNNNQHVLIFTSWTHLHTWLQQK